MMHRHKKRIPAVKRNVLPYDPRGGAGTPQRRGRYLIWKEAFTTAVISFSIELTSFTP